jgi:FAD/FMN-containing dehydrogenase
MTSSVPSTQTVAPDAALDPRRRTELRELRRRVAGQLHTPEDATWDMVRRPWNLSVEQTPLAVLEVQDAADVQAAIRWAIEHDVQVTAQPVGHGANDSLEGVLLLRTRPLDGIEIDLHRRTARVGAGVKAGELLAALDGTGLTFLAGSNPDVSVVGMTIGGGMSWFGRAYGLAAHSIVSAELVDGLGRARTVSRDENQDLLWAVRGGGGDFGIITRIEVRLHAAPRVYGGRLFWPVEQMPEVLRVFRAVTETAPPELTLWYHTYRFPPLPQVPEPLRGKAFASVAMSFLGEADEAERLITPVRALPGLVLDLVGDVPAGDLARIGGEPTEPAPGIDTSTLLERLDDDTVDRLVAAVGEHSGSPLAVFQIRHLGAAFANGHAGDGAAGAIEQPYQLFALGIPVVPPLVEPIRQALRRVDEAVAPASSGTTVPNFLHAGGDVDRCWQAEVRARLRAIKADADPLYTIRSNRSVLSTR